MTILCSYPSIRTSPRFSSATRFMRTLPRTSPSWTLTARAPSPWCSTTRTRSRPAADAAWAKCAKIQGRRKPLSSPRPGAIRSGRAASSSSSTRTAKTLSAPAPSSAPPTSPRPATARGTPAAGRPPRSRSRAATRSQVTSVATPRTAPPGVACGFSTTRTSATRSAATASKLAPTATLTCRCSCSTAPSAAAWAGWAGTQRLRPTQTSSDTRAHSPGLTSFPTLGTSCCMTSKASAPMTPPGSTPPTCGLSAGRAAVLGTRTAPVPPTGRCVPCTRLARRARRAPTLLVGGAPW
mmetsp:Transcript_3822/g.11020  ORF Transcript_3822/g.11020 Transcript_3822/m.11020 type:complete len:295 (-) Transcript_3822:546-1430(-)